MIQVEQLTYRAEAMCRIRIADMTPAITRDPSVMEASGILIRTVTGTEIVNVSAFTMGYLRTTLYASFEGSIRQKDQNNSSQA